MEVGGIEHRIAKMSNKQMVAEVATERLRHECIAANLRQ